MFKSTDDTTEPDIHGYLNNPETLAVLNRHGRERRTFSPEFKREAADLVLKQDYSFIEASRSLGVGESALRRWVDQVQQERTGVTPQSKALTPEQQKIQELESRIARLEREKSILKKATALLMSEDLERSR